VLFDKIASVYFIGKIYKYFSIGNVQPREPALCQLYRRTFVPYAALVYAEVATTKREIFVTCNHITRARITAANAQFQQSMMNNNSID